MRDLGKGLYLIEIVHEASGALAPALGCSACQKAKNILPRAVRVVHAWRHCGGGAMTRVGRAAHGPSWC